MMIQLGGIVMMLAFGSASLAADDDVVGASPPGGGVIGQIAGAARPLEEESDLDALIDRAAERRYVLLGEASHGTREFYTWRATISKRLIEEHGFNFIAVEGDWSSCLRVNRYVKHQTDENLSGRDVLKQFDRWPQWMWANEEVLELVEWLRKFNADREPDDRVGFYGIDIYGMPDSLEKALRHLRAIDEELAGEAEDAYACLAPYAHNPQAYVQAVIQQNLRCHEPVEAIVASLRARADDLRDVDAERFFYAKQNAIIVKRAERHYRTMIHRDLQSWNARAEHFAETVERLVDHYGSEDARAIVWAHNTHVGDNRATANPAEMLNIGRLMRERHDEEVFIVGFGTHRGEVLAGRQWGGPRLTMTIPQAIPGSIEDLLRHVGKPAALLLSEDLRDIDGLDNLIGHRAIGVTYAPERERQGNYVPTNLPQRYDAFIFIKKSNTLTPLHDS